MKSKVFLLSVMTFFVVFSFFQPGYSLNNSAPSKQCYNCHQGGDAPAYIRVQGIPDKYVPGGNYTITLTIESENESFGEVQGGFAAEAHGGELIVTDKKKTQLSYPYITHTKPGANHRQWTFDWKAPVQKINVVIYFMGLAANGDFSPAGDSMGQKVIEIKPQD